MNANDSFLGSFFMFFSGAARAHDSALSRLGLLPIGLVPPRRAADEQKGLVRATNRPPWRGLEIASSGQDLGLVVSVAGPPHGRWLFNMEIYPALWVGQRINRIIVGPLPIDQMANLAQPVDLQ